MASILPQQLVDKVNGIMDDATIPVNQQVDQIVQVLTTAGYAHHQTLLPSQVLVHPSNRSSQMISCHDMWHQGCQITQVGWKRSNLGEAIAMEISKDPTKRQNQLDANHKLIQESSPHMCPIGGQEGFLVWPCIIFHFGSFF